MIPAYAPLENSNNQPQISIKLVEPKPFTGNTAQAHMWLPTLKQDFIAVGLTYKATTKAADTLAACQYAVVLMVGNSAK